MDKPSLRGERKMLIADVKIALHWASTTSQSYLKLYRPQSLSQ